MAFVAGGVNGSRARVPPLVARLTIRRPRRRLAGCLVATAGTAALTAALLPFRNDIAPLSKGFGYLAVVVAAAAIGGLGSGIVASVLGFLTFNFFFLPPYNSFVIGSSEDIVVLFVFLGLSVLISAALAQARERADAAESREAELAGLQELSAQLVALGAGAGSYDAVLARVAELFDFSSARLVLDEAAPPAKPPARPGTVLSLSVGGRLLGHLVLGGDRPVLTEAEGRVLRAFSDQLAVVAERDRLSKAAVEAQVYKETDHLRRSLLAAVSHDLRSPLAAIKASVTDLLGDDAEHGPDDLREALESVNHETDRLASMIANLLDMSRIEGGTLRARLQGVDLGEVLSECVDRAMRRWPGLDLVECRGGGGRGPGRPGVPGPSRGQPVGERRQGGHRGRCLGHRGRGVPRSREGGRGGRRSWSRRRPGAPQPALLSLLPGGRAQPTARHRPRPGDLQRVPGADGGRDLGRRDPGWGSDLPVLPPTGVSEPA